MPVALVRRSARLPRYLLAASLVLAACSDNTEIGPAAIVRVRVDPDTLRVVLGASDTAQAFPIDERGFYLPGTRVIWASNDETVATVDEDGVVTGAGLGTTSITATHDRVSGSSVVIVEPAPVIAATPSTVQLAAIGQSGANPVDTVVITNSGGATLDQLAVGTIGYGPGASDWLTAVLDQATDPANLELTASVTGLTVGSYTATVPVTEPDATNSPFNIVVTLTISADVAANLALNAGDGQSATVGSAVATPPSVLVTDQFGNPVAGTAVTFAVTGGGGAITGASATSGANGIAAVGSWTLGATAGANGLSATAGGLAGSPVLFTASGTAAGASQASINAGNAQTAVAGQPVSTAPSVLVRDAFNNPVPGTSVTFAVATGGGSVAGGAAITNAAGVAGVTSWTLGTTAGANSLTATVPGVAGALTFTATGVAGTASAMIVQAGNGQSAAVGTAVAVAPAVRVNDANGNPVSGIVVTFTVASGGGSLTGGSQTTSAGGVATVGSWTLGTTAGANTLTASATGLPNVVFSATGTAGAAAAILLNAGDGQTAAAGSAVAIAPSVRVNDASNNPVAGVTVTFTVTAGGGSLTGASATTNASGIAQVTSWTLGPVAGTGNNALQATVGGVTGGVTFTASATAAAAATLTISAGNSQSATAGSAVGINPAVLLADQFGNPVPGAAVAFAVTGGGGSLTGGSATTSAQGIATVGSWTLGTTAGSNTLGATSSGVTAVSFTATGTAGPATQLVIAAGNGQSAPAGAPVAIAPAVQVRDQFNNPVAGVSVTFAVTGGGGSLSGATVVSNAAGTATVGSWTLGPTVGPNTLSATAPAIPAVTFTASGTAGAAAAIALNAGDNQTATVATAVGTAPSVLVTDAGGNPVAGQVVTFAVTGGGGSLTGNPATTNASGIATVGSWTLGTVAGVGNNTLTANTGGVAATISFTASGQAGAAASVTIDAGNGQTAPVGSAPPVDPAVAVADQFGNPVAGVTVTFAVASGGGSVTGATPATNAAGQASVGSWTLGTTSGSNTLTATVSGLPAATFTATGTAGAAASVAISAGDGQSAPAGTAVPIAPAVLVTDAFGNPVSGTTVTFAVATGGGAVSGATPTTNASGIASVGSWTLGASFGTNTLTATVTGLAPVTFTANGTAGAPSQIAISAGNNQSATAGTAVAVNPAVLVSDAGGNPVAGVSVTFAVTGGGGSVTGGTTTTDGAGIATVGSWTLGTAAGAGNNALQASASGVGGNVSFTASAQAGAAAQIAVSAGNGQSATVGSAVSSKPAALVSDQFGNPVSGVPVTFAVTGGGGSLTGSGASSNGSGIATVGSWTLGTTAGANTMSASATGLTGSPLAFSATGTPDVPTQVTVNTGNGQSAVAGQAVAVAPAVLVRDQFNNPVAGAAVTFSVTGGGGSVTGGSQTTTAGGVATVGSWILGVTVGANALSATVSGLTPANFAATGTTGPASIMAKNAGDAQATTVSTAVPIPPAVLVTDANGNPVSGVAITFAVASGGGSLTGASQTTNASGIATVGSWTLGPSAGVNNNSLSASATGLTTVTFTATANSGSADEILLSAGNGQTGTVGTALGSPLAALVEDATNNPVVGFGVGWSAANGGSVNCGGGPVPSCTATTNGSGISTAIWTLGPAAGAQQATASAGGLIGSPVSYSATANAAAAASIAISAGNGQSATVNTAVATGPAVLVTDAFGNPVSGVSVTFAVASGNGSVTGGSQTTNASGIATVTSWTLGIAAGSNTLTATSAGLAGSPRTFTATGTAGAAASVAISAGDGQSATVGTAVAVDPSVLVRDQFNNPVSGAAVTFAVATGGGSLTGGSQSTNASGIATVASWTLGGTAGSNTLTATVGALPAATFTATGTAGAAANVAINAGNGQSATVGTPVSVAPSVRVTDAGGNPVSGVTVTFAVTGGGGSLTGGSQSTNTSGIATVTSWTLGNLVGANSLSASVASVGIVSFSATGTAGAAATMTLSTGNGQTAAAGSAVAVDPAVLISDQFGNPVSGTPVTFAVATGGGAVGGGNATSNGSGIATVGSWTLGPAAGSNNNTLTATRPGLAGSPLTFTASATAGAPANVAISAGNGQSATVGTSVAVDPAVLVTDAFGNAVSGVSVAFAVASGGGSVTGGSQTTNASGIASVGSWTLGNAAGSNSLTATVTGVTPATFTATGTAGAPTQVAINAGNNQTAPVNTAVATSPSVIVQDAFNNPVSGVSVTFAVTGGSGTRTGGSQTTNGSGLAQVGSWTLGTSAGANSLSATVAGVGSVTFNATGIAGTAVTIALNAGNSQTATVNTTVAVAPSVIVQDAFSNPVSGVAVTFAITGGAGSLTGASQSTNASGIATVTSWRMGTVAGSNNNTLSATSAGLSGSPVGFSASAVAATAAQIAINAGDGQSATVGTPVSTAPQVLITDAFGNPVSGVAVTFAVTAGAGGVSGGSTTSNASGLATVGSWTLGTTAGANQLDATSTGLAGSPAKFSATGTAGAAATIARNAGNAQTATVNTTVSTAPSVLITDAFGNPVSGVAVTFAVTSGAGSVTGASQTSNGSGIATVGSWQLGTTAGSNSLSATATVGSVTFTATGTAGTPTQIAINAGNGQTATVNTAVATPPSVILRDAFNNLVGSASVTFAVTGGGGSVAGGSQSTTAGGIATVTSWTMGTAAGSNTLSATNGTAGTVSFSATGSAGAATQIAVSTGNNQTATVNTVVAIDPAVLVRDAFNNPVQGVSVAFSVFAGGGSATGTAQTTNSSGIATVTSWTVGTVAGANNNTLRATSSGLAGSPVAFTASATAGNANTIALVAGNGQTGTVNTVLPTNPSVRITDAFGNNVSGTMVTWNHTSASGSINCGGGNTTTTCTVTSVSTGLSTLSSQTLGTVAGTNTVTASVTGLSGSPVSFTATGTAGAVTTLTRNSTNNQSTRPNATVASIPSVIATDAFGNLVSGASVLFDVTNTTAPGEVNCVLFPANSCSETTNASGVATILSWRLSVSGVPTSASPAGGTYANTLSVTSGTGSTTFSATARWSFTSDVAPLFTTNSQGSCNGCHTAGNFGTYANIVGRAAVDNPGCGTLVSTNGALASSFLYSKIQHTQSGGCGASMPSAAGNPFLTTTERNTIRDWILNNAPNN